MPQPDNVKALYNELKNTYELGSEEDFIKYLSDDKNREALRKELESEYDVGDIASFSNYLGFGTGQAAYEQYMAQRNGQSAPAAPTAAQQQPAGGAIGSVQRAVENIRAAVPQRDMAMNKEKNPLTATAAGGNAPGVVGKVLSTAKSITNQKPSFDDAVAEMRKRTAAADAQMPTNPITGDHMGEINPLTYNHAANMSENEEAMSKAQAAERMMREEEHHQRNMEKPLEDAMRVLTQSETAVGKAWQNADVAAANESEPRVSYTNVPEQVGNMIGNAIRSEAAHLKHHDIDKLRDEAWNNIPQDVKQHAISRVAQVLRKEYGDGISYGKSVEYAEKLVRGRSDKMMYDYAVKQNAPKGWLDYLTRKINENAIGSILEGIARKKAGTVGDMLAREEAEQKYAEDNWFGGLSADVLKIGLAPEMHLFGGIGGATAKGGMGVASRVFGKEAARGFEESMGGNILRSALSSGGNFAAFEAAGEAENQFRHGGKVGIDENGEMKVGDYNLGDMLKAGLHGLVLGGSTGVVSPVVNNIGDKLVARTASTAGKMGAKGAKTLMSIAAEGTVFSLEDFINGHGDIDTWMESVGTMAGFKVSHGLKSALGTYEALKARPESRAGFETRLRELLDRRPEYGLTKDEKHELEMKGYSDLADLVYYYERTPEEQRKAIEERRPVNSELQETLGERGVESVPYNRFIELMEDKSISEAARAKMHYLVTGHRLPQSMVVATEIRPETDNGKVIGYTVESRGSNNGVITSRMFSSEKEAKEEKERLDRQAELNGVAKCEDIYNYIGDQQRLRDAYDIVAQWKHIPGENAGEALRRKLERDPKTLSPLEKEWLDDVQKAMAELPREEYQKVEKLRAEIDKEYGVKIDDVISKERNRRSDKEQKALNEYVRSMIGEAEESGVMETTDGNTPEPPADQKLLKGGYSKGYDADEQGRKDIALELSIDPNNESKREEWRGVQQRISDDADIMAAEQREEARKKQFRGEGENKGMLRPVKITQQNGEPRELFLTQGEIALTDSGLVDPEKTKEVNNVGTLTGYDPATGEEVQFTPADIVEVGQVTSAEQQEQNIEANKQAYIQQQKDAATPTATTTEPKATTADNQQQEPEPAKPKGEPKEFAPGMVLTVKNNVDGNGEERKVVVVDGERYRLESMVPPKYVPSESGNYVKVKDEEGNEFFFNKSIDYTITDYQEPVSEEQPTETVEPTEPPTAEVPTAEGITPQQQATQESTPEPAPVEKTDPMKAPMPMRTVTTGKGKNAKAETVPDFYAVPEEKTFDYIYNELGFTPEIADATVKANADETAKAINEHKAKEPQPMANPIAYKEAHDAWQRDLDAMNQQADYWKKVQSIRNQQLLAEAEERDKATRAERERRQKEIEAARKREEEAYQAELARRNAERDKKMEASINNMIQMSESEDGKMMEQMAKEWPIEQDAEAMEIMNDRSPRTLEEVVAWMLINTKDTENKIDPELVREHTGYGTADFRKFPFIFKKGGMSPEAFGEKVEQIARENDVVFKDNENGFSALLNVLGEVGGLGDLNNYIKENHRKLAEKVHSDRLREAVARQAEDKSMQQNSGMNDKQQDNYMASMEQAVESGVTMITDEETEALFSDDAVDPFESKEENQKTNSNDTRTETNDEGGDQRGAEKGGADESEAGQARVAADDKRGDSQLEGEPQPAEQPAGEVADAKWDEHRKQVLDTYDKEYERIEKADGERLRNEAKEYSDERLLNTYINNVRIANIFGKGREGISEFVGTYDKYKAPSFERAEDTDKRISDAQQNHLEAAEDAARQSFVIDVLKAELDRRGIEYKDDYSLEEFGKAVDWMKANQEEQPKEQKTGGEATKTSKRDRRLLEVVMDKLRNIIGDRLHTTLTEDEKRMINWARAAYHRVFHGSGADFERFDSSHMGEGEGAQAYGYGHYTTEVEGIGKTYAYASGNPSVKYVGEKPPTVYARDLAYAIADDMLKGKSFDDALQYTIDFLKKDAQRVLYTVEIPDDNGSNYIDWTKKPGVRMIRRVVDKMTDEQKERIASVPVQRYSDGTETIPQDDLVRRILYHVNNNGWNNLYDVAVVACGGKTPANEKAASELLHSAGFTGIKYPAEYRSGGREDNAKNYVIFDDGDLKITDKIKFFKTPQGEVYGFTVGGNIYVDMDIAKGDTPIHEYGHLWVPMVRESDPEMWEDIKRVLTKDKDVKPFMDIVRQRYPELTAEGREDDFMEEVFTHFSGDNGLKMLEEAAKEYEEQDGQGIISKAKAIAALNKVKEALDKFWGKVAQLFGIKFRNAREVANKMMKDFMDEVDPTKVMRERTLMNPRTTVPNVRGGWNERKIKDYLKHNSTRSGVYTAARAISEFDNVDELKDHMFYHGTVYGGEKLKPSITMSERDAERYGGGGYGERYWGISLTKSKKVASHFSGMSNNMKIYPVILLKGAKVIERPDFEDAADLNDHIVELWNDGVDAVWIGKGKQGEGEQELCVINPRAVVNIGTPDFYNVYQLGTKENPLRIADDAAIKKMYETAKEYASFPKPNKPMKPLRPLKSELKDGKIEMKSDEEYAAEMESYEKKLADYEQRMDEYNNSEELRKYEEMQEKARKDIRFQKGELNNGVNISIDDLQAQRDYLLSDNYVSQLDGTEFAKSERPLVERVAEYYKDKYDGKVERDGVGTVLLDERSVKDSIGHGIGRNKAIAFAAVPEIIKNGAIIDRQENWKGRGYGSVTFAAPIEIAGEGYVGVVVANEVTMSDGSHRFYLHEVVLQKNLQSEEFKTGIDTGSKPGDVAKILQKIVSAKNNLQNAENEIDVEDTNEHKRDAVNRLAKRFNVDIEVVENPDDIQHSNPAEQERMRKAPGFYRLGSGKVVIVLPNNRDASDVVSTVMHEVLTHKGLREVIGEDNMPAFLDEIYSHLSDELKQRVDAKMTQEFIDNMKGGIEHARRVATEEMIADISEKMPEDMTEKERNLWQNVCDWIRNAIDKLFTELKLPKNYRVTENDIRYMIWKSRQHMEGRKPDYVEMAQDVNKRNELRLDEEIVYKDQNPYDDVPRAVARDSYERMMDSGVNQFKEAVQDSMLSLKKLYEAILGKGTKIEDVEGYKNAYLAENRMHSASQAEIGMWHKDFMEPVVKAIHELTGGKRAAYDDLVKYMMAKHGLERNAVFAERDAQAAAKKGADYDDELQKNRGRDYAGLTALTGENDVSTAEAMAQKMVDDYEADHDTTELWNAINRATKQSLWKLASSGMMTPERYNEIRDMFSYYIPLQGFDETVAENVYSYMGNDGTLGYGTPIRHARGRKSLADDPIATMAMNGEAAIRQANRNEMKKRFLAFAQEHPSDLVSVSEVWLKHNDVTGEWEQVTADLNENDSPADVERKTREFDEKMEQLASNDPDHYKKASDIPNVPFRVVEPSDMKQHQVLVQRGGKKYMLTINGNPRAAQALNGLTNPDVFTEGVFGKAMNLGQWLNRQLSAFYTTRNPEFVLSNFLRDAIYSNSMSWVKESPNYAFKFHKNFGKMNPVHMGKLFAQWENGKLRERIKNGTASETDQLFYDFMTNGGETGWTSLRDIEKHKKELQSSLKREGNTSRKAWKALGDAFDLMNRSVENCARFAAFVTSREMGRSIDRSISDAKEVSVNFNKKGAGDKFLTAKNQNLLGKVGASMGGLGRGLYVFFNASMQGLNNIARATKRHPGKAAGVYSTLFALGALAPILAEVLSGGDDDDDKNAYYNLPEYIRRSNICFRFGKDMPWITIPLPIEFRAIYGLGELSTGALTGKEHYTDEEFAKQYVSQLSQVLPLDFMEGGGGWHAFVPSMIKPYVEAQSNTSWTGLPIYRDNTFKPYDPEWTRAYSSANKQLVDATKWLNEATGGDDVTKGFIDWNPAKIEYLLKGYLGGYFTMYDRLQKTAETALGNRDFEWRNIPMASRVLREGDERTEARKLTNEYFDLVDEYNDTKHKVKEYEKISKSDREDAIKYAQKLAYLNNSDEYTRYLLMEYYKPILDQFNDMVKEADGEQAKRIKDEENALRRELINIIHSIDDGAEIDVDAAIDEMLMGILNDEQSDISLRKKAQNTIKKHRKAMATSQQ